MLSVGAWIVATRRGQQRTVAGVDARAVTPPSCQHTATPSCTSMLNRDKRSPLAGRYFWTFRHRASGSSSYLSGQLYCCVLFAATGRATAQVGEEPSENRVSSACPVRTRYCSRRHVHESADRYCSTLIACCCIGHTRLALAQFVNACRLAPLLAPLRAVRRAKSRAYQSGRVKPYSDLTPRIAVHTGCTSSMHAGMSTRPFATPRRGSPCRCRLLPARPTLARSARSFLQRQAFCSGSEPRLITSPGIWLPGRISCWNRHMSGTLGSHRRTFRLRTGSRVGRLDGA